MKYDTTTLGGGVLIGTAALLLLVAALTGRGDMTSATLVLVGVGTFVGGVILLTQYRGNPVPPWVAGLAIAQPVVDLARLCADLGLQGNAHIVNGDDGLVQLVPVGETAPSLPPDDYSFISEEHGGGVLLVPTGRLLFDRLVQAHSLVVPGDVDGICTAIREVGRDALEVADLVEADPEGEGIVVRMVAYRLYEECRAIRAASPRCCTMIACPVCSLYACMVASGLNRTCVIEHVSTDDQNRSVRLVLRLLP